MYDNGARVVEQPVLEAPMYDTQTNTWRLTYPVTTGSNTYRSATKHVGNNRLIEIREVDG
ncbi:hypothetical protein BH789_gp005 [Gordonia phage GMA6]|uniref:Uncharacterized protein n=1 Tax=Gordonia phage GMA6 TaxID=1647285 RepID=A0A0K0NKP5_9CAUD|nr:hypothetical protein BH789_gp005 [Gordonia phage GMA6]AKL88286.1 hypothetical protein GMA6_5 [Gordonia phage GMA6]